MPVFCPTHRAGVMRRYACARNGCLPAVLRGRTAVARRAQGRKHPQARQTQDLVRDGQNDEALPVRYRQAVSCASPCPTCPRPVLYLGCFVLLAVLPSWAQALAFWPVIRCQKASMDPAVCTALLRSIISASSDADVLCCACLTRAWHRARHWRSRAAGCCSSAALGNELPSWYACACLQLVRQVGTDSCACSARTALPDQARSMVLSARARDACTLCLLARCGAWRRARRRARCFSY